LLPLLVLAGYWAIVWWSLRRAGQSAATSAPPPAAVTQRDTMPRVERR
jgi:hypothetical protein